VLGFDTEMSMDHDWGPRLVLFLSAADVESLAEEIDQMLRDSLPAEFLGFSTYFTEHSADRTKQMARHTGGEASHLIEIQTVRAFVEERLGSAFEGTPSIDDWLRYSEQALLEVTAGEVFVDMTGELTALRGTLAYFPDDIWLYRMASRWARLSELEAFVGRAGAAGDDLGSRLVAAAIVRELLLLAFNIERVYAPYEKWLGTAFRGLSIAQELLLPLERSLAAETWLAREDALCDAYRILATAHNGLNVTAPLSVEPRPFHSRSFQVIAGRRFADALVECIGDGRLRKRFKRQSWI
jgi:hypothetical protein